MTQRWRERDSNPRSRRTYHRQSYGCFWRSEGIARPNHRAPHMGNRGIVESQTFLRLSEVSADDVFEIVEVDHDVWVEGIDIIHRDKPCRHGPFVPTCLLI